MAIDQVFLCSFSYIYQLYVCRHWNNCWNRDKSFLSLPVLLNFLVALWATWARVCEIRQTRRTCPAKFGNLRRRAVVEFNQMFGEKLEMSGEAQNNFAYSAWAKNNQLRFVSMLFEQCTVYRPPSSEIICLEVSMHPSVSNYSLTSLPLPVQALCVCNQLLFWQVCITGRSFLIVINNYYIRH